MQASHNLFGVYIVIGKETARLLLAMDPASIDQEKVQTSMRSAATHLRGNDSMRETVLQPMVVASEQIVTRWAEAKDLSLEDAGAWITAILMQVDF